MGLTAIPFRDGKVVLGGRRGFEQVSTGSVVRPGHALLIEYSPVGEMRRLDSFGNERDNQIQQLRGNEEGVVFLSGSLNGPVTHDAPEDRFNQSALMRLGL